ncbi:uncharacterized protein LOC135696168 isoform X2 [Rhopilema esculentum]|uniref:uncharacterized protein LOC135696168 isoform X2 n=1 Tax=Rhopilema esculentum TaxID=499914 RepID=UPI0031DBB8F7
METESSSLSQSVGDSVDENVKGSMDVAEGSEAQTSTNDGDISEVPHSSDQGIEEVERPTQDEAVASTDVTEIQPVDPQVDVSDANIDGSQIITITTVGETNLSNLTQVSHVTSDQHAEVTHISGLPPGVSLIQADQGQDGEGAIFLLVTGPVDGEGGPANAIAVDAATAAAMASLQNPLEAVTSGQAITIEELATAVSTSRKSQSDSVAEILSGLTGERMSSTTDDSAVVQVAANAEAQAAATGKAYPTPSEVSLAQDILALASSALSSSANKADAKDVNAEDQEVKVEAAEEYTGPDLDGKPAWAQYLADFQKIGDSYYGFVKNEVEMDQVLNAYKKETNSLFAIRQTPSPVKEDNGTVRLMWKSQHVPYDGIPFINIGRRATVMECEHGPRKKTNALKRMFNSSPADKASLKSVVNLTCPSRVFIKKVRKFPEFKVVSTTDPKILRVHQEQALKQLRELGMNTWSGGEIRLYMQLPDASTHRYHMFGASTTPTVDSIASSGEYRTDINQRVVTKVKEVVRQGVTSPFVVRQIARNYVEKEMVAAGEEKVPKHDKKYFPPMIEIQNLIQQIQADLISGALTPLPMPAEGYPQAKPKKRRSSAKMYGEPAVKRLASNGDVGGIKRESDEGDSLDGAAESTTIGTFSLTLPEGQLENFSIANLNMEQLQQLAKIGLLALNNVTSGKSNVPLATATVTDSGTIEIEASVSQAESTSTVDTSDQIPNEAVVLLTSSMQDQVTSSEAQEAVQAIESVDVASSSLENAPASSSAEELPSMAVSDMETEEAQPSTTTDDDAANDGSVVSSAEATTTTENTEPTMDDVEES